MVRVFVAAMFLMGCVKYQTRRITLPQTSESAACADEALEAFNRCMVNQRGRVWCAKQRDKNLLRCPGAREGDPETPGVETYALPGYRP